MGREFAVIEHFGHNGRMCGWGRPLIRSVSTARLPMRPLVLAVLLGAWLPAHDADAAQSGDAGAMTIHVTVIEAHDRITPTPIKGIIKRHETDVVVKPNKQITESTRVTDVSSRPYDTTAGRSATLGAQNGNVVWHVLGPNKLQRMASAPRGQILSVWTIETDANRGCRVDAKILMQQGMAVTAGKIQGFDTPATFTNFRVLQATCTIE